MIRAAGVDPGRFEDQTLAREAALIVGEETVGTAGGAVGGAAGGAAAGLLCGPGAPACVPVGALLGAIVGGVAGDAGGSALAGAAFDETAEVTAEDINRMRQEIRVRNMNAERNKRIVEDEGRP